MGAARPGSAGVGRQVIREFSKADVAGGRMPGCICLKHLEVGELGREVHARADWIGAAPKCGLECSCGWRGSGGGMGVHGEAPGENDPFLPIFRANSGDDDMKVGQGFAMGNAAFGSASSSFG